MNGKNKMNCLYIEITRSKKYNTITGRFKIVEDDLSKRIVHTTVPSTVDWVIIDLCRKLGFKDDYDCLETSLKYIYQKKLLMKLTEQTPMFERPLFCVNKYRKKLLDFKKMLEKEE